MVAPVWEDALLDLLVKTLLHAVHVFKFIGLSALVLGFLPARYRILQ